MKPKLSEFLIDRIGSSHPAPAIFTRPEFNEWSDASLGQLLTAGLLTEVGRLNKLACGGCEQDCVKPVVVRATSDQQTKFAYINCDEEPNHGRIPVPIENLMGYQSSPQHLATFICNELKLETDQNCAADPAPLGKIRGRYGWRDISIVMGTDVTLKVQVGRQEERLQALIVDRSGNVVANKSMLQRMANRKEPAALSSSSTDRSKQRQRARAKAARDKKIVWEAKRLRRNKMSWPDVSRQIEKMDFIQNEPNQKSPITADTIRRVISRNLSS